MNNIIIYLHNTSLPNLPVDCTLKNESFIDLLKSAVNMLWTLYIHQQVKDMLLFVTL
jgi:hypothetical protein